MNPHTAIFQVNGRVVLPDDGALAPKDVGCKVKDKVHPRIGPEGQEEEWRYSSTLSLTEALDGMGGQPHALADLPPGKARYPLCRGMGGPQGWSGRVRKISPPLGFDHRTVQLVASR
jgi:hypothetical protein